MIPRHLSPAELLDLAEGAPSERARTHVAACAACRRAASDLGTTMSWLMEGPAGTDVPEPPPFFWEQLSARVREAVAAEAPAPAWRAWLHVPGWRVVVPVAAVLVAALVAWRADRPPGAGVERGAGSDVVGIVQEAVPPDDLSLLVLADLTSELDWEAAVEAGVTPTAGAIDSGAGVAQRRRARRAAAPAAGCHGTRRRVSEHRRNRLMETVYGHGVRMARLVLVLSAAVLIGAPLGAAGQERSGGPGRPGPGGAGVTPGEVQRMLDGYELMQAQEALQLTDEQFPRFLPKLRALQDARRRHQVARARLLQEMRRMTQARAGNPGEADEARLREQLKALDEQEARAASEIRKATGELTEVLTVHQQARFRLFEEMMEQRKVELVLRARQANRQNRF